MVVVAPTKELNFEDLIEAHLLDHGWERGNPVTFDPVLGLDADEMFTFIGATQQKAWDELVERRGGDQGKAQAEFRKLVAKRIDESGTLHVLRRGVTDMGIDFRLAYFKPEHGLTPELVSGYEANRCAVVRQLPYSAEDPGKTLDLALLVNGIPTATAELKNTLTGQNTRDAIRQYKTDRDPTEPIFAERALVNFALDPDSVYITTHLTGKNTTFLPFNQGSGGAGHSGGEGNPPAAEGRHATAYLWEELWQRDAWLDLLARFIHAESASGAHGAKQPKGKRPAARLIFPRFQQWDAVRKLVADARQNGAGRSYLIQHSAGSGKSNTVAWLAHRLSGLHDAHDRKVFDKVIVVTDRVVLDRQLQSTVFQFDHEPGVVEKIESGSTQLAEALESGTAKIVISTLQKFPFVLEKIGDLSERRFAVIVDEAHSSQSGEAAKALRSALGAAAPADDDSSSDGESDEPVEPDEVQDLVALAIERSAKERGRQPNLSFFAFTATPTGRTQNLFGTDTGDGHREPFHIYSMRQAIEEGFILDVLKHFLPYKVFWKVASRLEEDPEVERSKATSEIARFVSARPETLEEKAKIIVEHFRATTRRKIGGKAKAMVVTASREQAVRTYFALKHYISEHGYRDCVPLVAFSDAVDVDGESYTEAAINGFGEKQLPDRFAGDDYRLLVVAEKYQTGFDQPLLHTMYVDKQLGGLRAVQTLSRLNRVCPDKDDTFVLDFVNAAAEIQSAFEPYYDGTIAETTDPNELYSAHSATMGFGVIAETDETAFAAAFLGGDETAHADLYVHLAPAKERYDALGTDVEMREFRAALAKFCDLYSFLSQAIAFHDIRLERSYIYGRHLLRVLPRERNEPLDLGGDLALTHLRFQADKELDASIAEGGDPLPGESGEAGAVAEPAKDQLSEIIRDLNERHGLQLGAGDEVIHRIADSLADDAELREAAEANPFANFALLFNQKFEEKAVDARNQSWEFFERTFGDPNVRRDLADAVGREVYRRLVEGGDETSQG
jgi:type I restriction enzyme R subunit